MCNRYAVLPIVNSDNFIIIDADDWPVLKRFRWYIPRDRYPTSPRPFTVFKEGGLRHYKRLARVITRAPKGMYPKHLNGNPLDCRRENLALVTNKALAGEPLSSLKNRCT